LEPLDEQEAQRAGADAILKKPFEASVVVNTIKPLAEAAQFARGLFADAAPVVEPAAAAAVATALPAVDPERIRAAVTLALDAALPAMIEEITERVLVALGH
jgi:2-methylcitrate dehydratase PrpD